MSNEKIAMSKSLIGGLAGLGGLGVGAAGIGGYNALKDPDPIEEHPDYAPPPAPEPEPEKDYFDKGMDWAEENIYNPSWDFISQQSQNPGTRKLLTALALIALLGGGSYMFGKNKGRQDILNRFQ
tara:strand:- start:5470 stop:5844 length:375 start_codon:yes stop_codon:yes gene_type:complete